MHLAKQSSTKIPGNKFAQFLGKWLNKCNKIKYLQFTKIYIEMPIDFWEKILSENIFEPDTIQPENKIRSVEKLRRNIKSVTCNRRKRYGR